MLKVFARKGGGLGNIEVGARGNVVLHPLYQRMSLVPGWSGEAAIRIENYDCIARAYGWAVARKVHSAILLRVHRALGDCGVATPDGNGVIDILLWDAAAIGGGPVSTKAAVWLTDLTRNFTLDPVATEAGPVHAIIGATAREGFCAPIATETGFPQDACVFAGDDDAHRTYRSDMSAVSPLLRALSDGRQRSPASRDSEVDVLWRPVAATRQAQGCLIFEASLGLIDAGGQILGVEAAVDSAERLGLVELVDQFLVSRAVAELLDAPSFLSLSVAVSASSLLPGAFWGEILAVLERRPTIASRLILEVRGSSGQHDWTHAAGLISRLRKAGCKLSIGNFGTGFSSIRQLVALRPDFITVDRRFLSDVGLLDGSEDVLVHLVGLARALGAEAVIDGVDGEAASVRAASLGTAFQKGSWLGAPRLSRPWVNGFFE